MSRRARTARWWIPAVAAVASLTLVAPAGGASAPATVEVRAPLDTLVVTRSPGAAAFADVGVTLAARGVTVELRRGRAGYGAPWSNSLRVRRADGRTLRLTGLASSQLSPYGLRSIARVTVSGPNGVVADVDVSWCPGSRNPQRVDLSGPATPAYPPNCFVHPFALGLVNGLSAGWASTSAYRAALLPASLPDGTYQVSATVSTTWARRLGIAADARTVSYPLVLTTAGAAAAAPVAPAAPLAPLPAAVGTPPTASLPDLVALPAYSMSVGHVDGRDELRFNATAWNAGPGPLVIDGTRVEGTETMVAEQVFLLDGTPVARRGAGEMVFHHGEGHDHWHYVDFIRYELVTPRGQVVATSGKQAWCTAPTDPIDLRVPGAVWRPASTGLSSSCGGVEATVLRQVLPTGWGDTYRQTVGGQAIEVTDVPNGRYLLRVSIDPGRRLTERRTTNNVSTRLVVLGGTVGTRTLLVPPYRGIDTG